MKRFLYTIFTLAALVLFGCTDELSLDNNKDKPVEPTLQLSIEIDDAENRTRAIDLTPGGALYLNHIWVGIYRKSDGVRVGGTSLQEGKETDLGNRLTASGAKLYNVITVTGDEYNFNGTLTETQDLCVVGVANYEDIKTGDGTDLYTALKNADTWADFIKITVDAQQQFANQTPMLMGYLYRESEDNTNGAYIYTKVNQFGTSGDKVDLFGPDDKDIYVTAKVSDGKLTALNTSGFILKLRRMRSKINVLINQDPDQPSHDNITIVNAQYQVYNKPKSAFLAQRRTNVFDYTNTSKEYPANTNYPDFETTPGQKSKLKEYSSNSADVDYVVGEGYFNDDDFLPVTDNKSFSFEHFENKHWARQTVGSDAKGEAERYHDREEKNSDGSLKVLTDDNGLSGDYAWNDYASYFVLKLSIYDSDTNRYGEVEYVIHEGFCNDKDGIQYQRKENGELIKDTQGNPVPLDFETRLKDFSCIRNTDYYYYITISGINDIYVQVTDHDKKHTNDEKGKLWRMIYFPRELNEGMENNYVETKIAKHINFPISFYDNDADKEATGFSNSHIAFRLVGSVYDEELNQEVPVDVCYNFDNGSLRGFSHLWPEPQPMVTQYFVDSDQTAFQALEKYSNPYFDELMKSMYVQFNGLYITIKEYIENIQDEKVNPAITGFLIDEMTYYEKLDSEKDSKRAHLRGLYIFDLQKALEGGSRVLDDNYLHTSTGYPCSYIYEINAAEQYPAYMDEEKYELIKVGNSPYQAEANVSLNNFSNNHGGTGILLSEKPDLAIRAVGYLDKNTYYDYVYNFNPDDYKIFNASNNWPEFNDNTTYISKGRLGSSDIPAEILNGIQIYDGTTSYPLDVFANAFENGEIDTKSLKLGFTVNPTNIEIEGKDETLYQHYLYVFDKKNRNRRPPELLISNNNSTVTYQIYSISQLPNLIAPQTLFLPKNLPTIKSDKIKFNIIDTGLDAVTFKNLPDFEFGSYSYRFYGVDNNENQSSYDYYYIPDSENNSISIPMWVLPGTDGKIYMQAVPTDGYNWTASNIQQIGTYSLKDHSAWKAGDGENYDAAVTHYKNSNNRYTSYTQSYLRFISDASDKGFIVDSAGDLQSDGGKGYIELDVFKPCKLRVTAWHNGSRQVQVSVNGTSLPLSANIPTSKNTTYQEFDLSPYIRGDKNLVKIAPSGGGLHFVKIEIISN